MQNTRAGARNHSYRRKSLAASALLWLLLCACLLSSLAGVKPDPTPTPDTPSPSPSATRLPSRTPSPSPTVTATAGLLPTSALDPALPVWQRYLPPGYPPARPVRPPLTGLRRLDTLRVLVLLGVDVDTPRVGRTDAVALALINPRSGRASLISLPPDLAVYIPGYAVQRLQTAYALGGFDLLAQTLEYNLGVRPDDWLLVQRDSFALLVDELDGIYVPVEKDFSESVCGKIRAGTVAMDGAQALCYARYRTGMDEYSRNLRQQEVLRGLLLRLAQGGTLTRLPDLYAIFSQGVQTNLKLDDLLAYIPLFLNLADPGSVVYFTLDEAQLDRVDFPGKIPSQVFQLREAQTADLMQQALDFAASEGGHSERVRTLQYELTISPSATNTPTPTITPTRTETPWPTITKTRTVTRTRTETRTRTATRTATEEGAP